MIYLWWDDAMAVANGYAKASGARYRVRAHAPGWTVEVAGGDMDEVCS